MSGSAIKATATTKAASATAKVGSISAPVRSFHVADPGMTESKVCNVLMSILQIG